MGTSRDVGSSKWALIVLNTHWLEDYVDERSSHPRHVLSLNNSRLIREMIAYAGSASIHHKGRVFANEGIRPRKCCQRSLGGRLLSYKWHEAKRGSVARRYKSLRTSIFDDALESKEGGSSRGSLRSVSWWRASLPAWSLLAGLAGASHNNCS